MLKAVFLDGSDSRAVRGALYEGASIAAVHGTIYADSTASCGNHGATPSFGTRVPGSLGGSFQFTDGARAGADAQYFVRISFNFRCFCNF